MLDPFVGLIGLGDSSKVPLADAKKDAPGGPQTAVPEAAKKVANSLPADLPVSPPVGGREITFRSAEPEGAYERDSVPGKSRSMSSAIRFSQVNPIRP